MAKLTIQKSKFNDFKKFLDSRNIKYRPGKNPRQKLQIEIGGMGWSVIYHNKKYPGYYTAQENLRTLIYSFLRQSEGEEGSPDCLYSYNQKYSKKNAVADTVQEKLKDGTYHVHWVAADIFRISKV